MVCLFWFLQVSPSMSCPLFPVLFQWALFLLYKTVQNRTSDLEPSLKSFYTTAIKPASVGFLATMKSSLARTHTHTHSVSCFVFLYTMRLSRSVMSDTATPWTVTHQAPLSLEFYRQEDWSGLPFPPPGDLPDPGFKPASPVSPALQVDSVPAEPSRNGILSIFKNWEWFWNKWINHINPW